MKFKKIWNAVTTILLVLFVAFAAVMFLPRLFGMKPMAVLSGSMEPSYHVGSLIYVNEVSPENIKIGDPITFNLDGSDTVVTHRVIDIDKENKCFYTKGDANDNPDGGSVAYSDLLGKPIFSIPYLGYAAVYLNTRTGMIVLVTAIIAMLILTFLPDLIMGSDKERGGKKNEEDIQK